MECGVFGQLFWFLIGAWMSRMDLRVEEKLICEVGCIGSWLCVEREARMSTFEVVNINDIVGAVLDVCFVRL